jgi:thiol-disulfide isomerase/thioredoxin
VVGIAAVVLVVTSVGWWWGSGATEGAGNSNGGVRVGSLAPDFGLRDVKTGEIVRLSEMRGRPVWVNFWATWCPACKEEMAEIQRYYERYKGDGLVVIGVDVQESEASVREFVGQGGYEWSFVVDSDGGVTDRFFVDGIPAHFFVDAEGVIRAIQVGGIGSESGGNMKVEECLSRIMK